MSALLVEALSCLIGLHAWRNFASLWANRDEQGRIFFYWKRVCSACRHVDIRREDFGCRAR
jgi:hypothetical protein